MRRSSILVISLSAAVLVVLVWLWLPGGVPPEGSAQSRNTAVPAGGGVASRDPAGIAGVGSAVGTGSELWPGVDVPALRREMPDNRYWTEAFPTTDPAELAQREQRDAARNEVFGKIQAGTASLQEIEAYYDDRNDISTDYVAFVDRLLAQHHDAVPDRDRGLLELARDMHADRLESLPRERARALERKALQDEARAAWNP